MKTNMNTMALVAVALSALATAGFGADKKASVNAHDEKFIKETAAGGMAEVKLAELGVKKAERADVKAFAEQMVSDHTAMNKDLETLAEKKGVDLSAVIDPKAATTFQKLEKSSGKDFDDAFIKDMMADHKKTVSNFEAAQKKVEDADLKAFVEKGLPGLKGHLDHVNKLAGK